MRNTKGKTYEEIYGIEKVKELRELRKNNAISQMKIQRKGKNFKEIYGEEKARELFKLQSKNRAGVGNTNYKGGKIELICKECGKAYLQNVCKENSSNYCSNECGYASKECKVIRICKCCNREYSTKASINLLYCSMKCRDKYQVLENNPNWQGGKSFEPYNINWTIAIVLLTQIGIIGLLIFNNSEVLI